MNGSLSVIRTACPHDCPSACVLEVERLSPGRIGRVRGSAAYDYTAGTCCAKVARYAERTHHPDRLTRPLLRVGAKGEGRFAPIGWDEALDRIAEAFRAAAARHGPEAVWPYHSGGTLGVLSRWGIDRLRHVMGYSRQKSTICVTPAESGWKAGIGAARGSDPRRLAEADLILMWGGNPVATQVNLMSHIQAARRSSSSTPIARPRSRPASPSTTSRCGCGRPSDAMGGRPAAQPRGRVLSRSQAANSASGSSPAARSRTATAASA
jgi:anaerobic selenocysteine-containing dehydrogenase